VGQTLQELLVKAAAGALWAGDFWFTTLHGSKNILVVKPQGRYIYRPMTAFTNFFPAFRATLFPMGKRSAPPIGSIRQCTLAQVEQRLSPALDPSLLKLNPRRAHSRQRIFTLQRTFWCWIWQVLQANTSCREVVRQVQALFSLHGREVDDATGAYCQSRSKLSLGLLRKIFNCVAARVEQSACAGPFLQGRSLRSIDASGTRLPDTPENRAAFPPPKNQPKGTGFPYLKVISLFSLQSGAVLAHSIGSLLNHELRLFLGLRKALQRGDIVVMDRAFGVYLVGALLQLLGVDFIARLSNSRKINFRQAHRTLGPHDALFLWSKPPKPSVLIPLFQWLSLPALLTVRVLRTKINRPGFRIKTLTVVTTLLDPQLYPATEILEAYGKRWRIEMCFDDLKTTLEMEYLSCLTPKMVHKELLIFLIAHNFLRWIMAQAAQANGVALERISFKGCLDAFRQFSQALAQIGKAKNCAKKREELWQRLLTTLARDLIPLRPGRREPRAVKRKLKYPYLNKTRKLFKDPPGRRQRALRARRTKNTTLNS
jgi:hypothetical protein